MPELLLAQMVPLVEFAADEALVHSKRHDAEVPWHLLHEVGVTVLEERRRK